MAIDVKLDVFEGPLDLLLHLIDTNKIDIYDIPIVKITDQYLEYVNSFDFPNMDVMSEFLVMAAMLLRIKSKTLLPVLEEDSEDEEEIDEREELTQRLIEYKMCKCAAQLLDECRERTGEQCFRTLSVPDDLEYEETPVDYDKILKGIDIDALKRIFDDVLKRQEFKEDKVRSKYGKVIKDKITVGDKMTSIRKSIGRSKRASFRSLLNESHDRIEVIVTFLAILELTRNGEADLCQDELFGEIYVLAQGES